MISRIRLAVVLMLALVCPACDKLSSFEIVRPGSQTFLLNNNNSGESQLIE